MQSDAIFRALAEKHEQQMAEIQRKRDNLTRIQNEIKEKIGILPYQYIRSAQQPTSGFLPPFNPATNQQKFLYGNRNPTNNMIRGLDEVNQKPNLIDLRPQYDQYSQMYITPKPITIRMRTPPPPEIRHIDPSGGGAASKAKTDAGERWQQSMFNYYKDYHQTVADQIERNRAFERENYEITMHDQKRRTEESVIMPMLKEQLERSRKQSEDFYTKIGNYVAELARSLEEDRRRRREDRQKADDTKRVTTGTQVHPEREQTSTQVNMIDEARMRSVANRMAYISGVGPVQPSGTVSGYSIYDAGVQMPLQDFGGTLSGQSGGHGVQILNAGNGNDVIIAGVPQTHQLERVKLASGNVVTHTHDNPYVQSIIAEIRQELDDIDRERRRLLIKERTKSAEQHLEKMLADLALEKERLCREIVSLARVNALMAPEGENKTSTMDPATTSAIADVLQVIKDQLRRVCKIQSEANLIRHETVMTHLKTLWSHSDAHTVVEAAPQHPLKRIPAPIVPAPIPIDPPTYGLLPALVLYYDFICGIPNGSLTSVVLQTSVVRKTEGRKGEDIIDLLVDLGELPPAGVSHASRLLDGVQSPGVASLPLENRGVAMIRYKHELPQQFPADPCLFALVTLGGQQATVTTRSAGFARCLIPLVRGSENPESPSTGRFVTHFYSQSNLFSSASLYYRLVRLEDAEAELRNWPVSLARMNLYLPAFTKEQSESQIDSLVKYDSDYYKQH